MTDFEDILNDVGLFGSVQRRIFILISLLEAPSAWAMFLPVFTHLRPNWQCVDNLQSNSSFENASNFCYENGSTCDNIQFEESFTSIVTEWELLCKPEKNIPSYILTIQMVGVFVGAFIFGQLADMFGRKPVMFSAYGLMLVTLFLSAFSFNWQIYAGLRFFIGAFFGGTMLVNQVMPLEFVGKQWRTLCGCIGGWAAGVMMLGGLAYAVPDWRHLTMAVSLPPLFLLITWWFIPESPRWLLQKGKFEEAEKILTHIAKGNKKSVPDVEKLKLFFENNEKIIKKRRKHSYWDLFRNFQLSKNTCILVYTWFVCSVVYYGVSLNVGALVGNRYLNMFLMGLVEMPALIFVIFVNNWIGRRKTLSLLLGISGVSCFAMLFLKVYDIGDSWAVIMQVLALLGKSGISGAWAGTQVFSAEIFPTVIRNIGVGLCSMAARVGGIVAPQILLLNSIAVPLPFVVFGCLGIICAILVFFLPETLNTALPDTLPPRECCKWCKKADNQSEAELEETVTVDNNRIETEPLQAASDIKIENQASLMDSNRSCDNHKIQNGLLS